MSAESSRIIHRTHRAATHEIQDLLAGVFAAELVAPSERLWLISPWLSNIELLDDRAAAFRGIASQWGRKRIRLFEVLAELARRGCEVVIATRPGEVERSLKRLQQSAEDDGARPIRCEFRSQLHTKGLLGDDYALTGSMNFTRNGVEHLEEMVTYTTDPETVGALRLEFTREYGEAQ